VSLALKRFQPGLRGLEVTALLGCITTALNKALSQPIGEGTLTYKDLNRFSGTKTASRRVIATSIAPLWQ